MKKFIPHLSSGLLGGLMVLGGFMVYDHYVADDQVVVVQENTIPVRQVSNRAGLMVADFSVAAEKASPSVVYIKAQESEYRGRQNARSYNPFSRFFGFDDFDMFYAPRQGSGSGVVISPDGYIVTNSHVVDFADILQVTLHDGREYEAFVVGSDPDSDLALLKIDAEDLSPISLGKSEEIKVGEWALAIGNPFELTNTVTAGIISAKGRDIGLQRNGDGISAFIQTDAAVNPGNSGGALVNMQGELIGINTAIFSRDGSFVGYSFAIPVEIVSEKIEEMLANPSRGFLGVTIQAVDEEMARQYGFQVNDGVVVLKTEAGGSAFTAGVKPEDIIVGFDNKSIKDIDELKEVLKDKKAGEKVLIEVDRYGERLSIPVVLKAG